ncbi:MAG: hypothetical protein WAT79_05305 [Saprospiraceae bacterium]
MRLFYLQIIWMGIIIFILTNPIYSQEVEWEGYYLHKPSNKSLVLEKAQKGIMVKGFITDTWRFFKKKRTGIFIDNRGNRIELIGNGKIIYVQFNSRRGLNFYQKKNKQAAIDSHHFPQDDFFSSYSLEGLWKDYDQNIYLIVVETREGIKVRLQNSTTWYAYLHQNNDYFYNPDTGNKYKFQNNVLQYFHRNESHQLTFHKISDNFDGY